MPFLTINTNRTPRNKKDFLQDCAAVVAEVLGKPLRYVIVDLKINENMAFCGSVAEGGALLLMKSVGFVSGSKTILAQKLTDLTESELNIARDTINIEFADMSAADVAIGGTLLE